MRYIPHTSSEIKEMLNTIGVNSIDDLFASIPSQLKTSIPLQIGDPLSEPELLKHINELGHLNQSLNKKISFLGGGAYRHYIPSAVKELSSRSEFVTPYTPYQPEISQGTLQAIFEYQSMMCRLFSMDISNASHYDGATALAEAALMSRRIGGKRKTICISANLHPEYKDIIYTIFGKDDDSIKVLPSVNGLINRSELKKYLNEDLASVIVQYPNFFGIAENFQDISDMVHDAGGIMISATPETTSLGLLIPPGDLGADIAVGEGISLGLPVSFGGPTLGIFTAKEAFLRNMPGRICGQTVDSKGKNGYVLTISTREQHIRREKATSNICSNQALCATTAAIYLSLLGKTGFRKLAELNYNSAEYAKTNLTKINGVKLKFTQPTFNEFVLELSKPAITVINSLLNENIFAGIDLGRWFKDMQNCLLVCVTETNSKDDIDLFISKMKKALA
ncbi:MAG: aminomethyl-transferring glycine dehydrogenase [Deltaproteobacteria bacterium CG07_land_8_20_14_0_80_38_7]|nr:MAG: aminomethyl-transferring glycine dehydrogenase [Deltaproteobacteria bacterium CG07_land_8_20_14_0_80_38_7]